MDIKIKPIDISDIFNASKMMADSCRQVYIGIMNDEYLSSISNNQYVALLETGLKENTIDCLLAVIEDEIVGISVTRKSKIKQYMDDAEMYALYLLPNYIGKGIGSKLYVVTESLLKQQGHKYCSLIVLTQNNRAIQFYKLHGYQKTEHTTSVTLMGQELSCDIMRKYLLS